MITSLKQQVLWTDRKGIAMDAFGSLALVAALTYFFYRSIYAFFPLLAVGGYMFLLLQERRIQREEREYLLQFKECMQVVATNMKAGYAAENAFLESEKDMITLFGEQSRIAFEIRNIRLGLMNHVSLEKLLAQLSERCKAEEVKEFAEVFQIAKRGRGNLSDIMESTCNMIGKRIEQAEEIRVYLASKKMQQYIMDLMPIFVAGYMELTNPGYFAPLYHNLQGNLLMTLGLAIYFVAFMCSEKILKKAGG